MTRNEVLGKIGVISFWFHLSHLPVSGVLRCLTGAEESEGLARVVLTAASWPPPFAVASLSCVAVEWRNVDYGRTFRHRRSSEASPKPVTATATAAS